LARAEASKGLVPKALAAAIDRISPDDLNIAALGAKTANAGVPAIPFVKAVEAKLPAKLRGSFHFGATSQDILDTALVLQVADGLDLIGGDLTAIVAGLARLAKSHRRTPCVGRTYGQHAAPVTFGYVAATWLSGIAQVGVGLPRIRERALVASLGGPVGTLSVLGDKGPAVVERFARELGLAAPALPWHTTRARIAETGAWLAMLIAALAKMATDVVFLSSTEVGEAAEPHVAGRGGSSAMPHKRNPVSATVILAAHGAAKGHVVTLIDAMAAADQRPAAAWHAEWHALPQLFGLASGALREARRLAEGLVVDKTRMRANLGLTGGLLFADAVAAALAPKLGREAAHRLVEQAADAVRSTGRPLHAVLARDKNVPPALRHTLDAAFDLTPSVKAAAATTDRVLAGVKSAALFRRRR
jgi:3-carboxy-cis,cis-muconate cycloisomerase